MFHLDESRLSFLTASGRAVEQQSYTERANSNYCYCLFDSELLLGNCG